MTIESINLYKLLQIMYLPANKQASAVNKLYYEDQRKRAGRKSGGGDFYLGFWTDAKAHIRDILDIHDATKTRIEKNFRYKKLYTLYEQGFLRWWNEKRRWQNEPYKVEDKPTKGKLHFAGLGTVKVNNALVLILTDSQRIIYPYFCEEPPLSAEAARIAFWAMGKILPQHKKADMRILDVIRGNSFAPIDCPEQGDEEKIFTAKYAQLNALWKERAER